MLEEDNQATDTTNSDPSVFTNNSMKRKFMMSDANSNNDRHTWNKVSTNSHPYLWENFKRDSIDSTVILCRHCGEDIVDRDSSRSNAAVALLHMTGCKLLSIVHSNRYAVDTRIIDTNMAKREADPTSTDTLRNYLRMPSHPEMLATSTIRGFLNPSALDDPYVKARYECIKLPPNN